MSSMSPGSLPPGSWWEEHFFPRLEAIAQQALQDLAARGGTAAQVSGATGTPQIAAQSSIIVPTLASTMANAALASKMGNVVPLVNARYATRIEISLGSYPILAYQVPVDYVALLTRQTAFRTSWHDPNATLIVTADNNVTLFSGPMSEDVVGLIPDGTVVRDNLSYTAYSMIQNYVRNATITIDPTGYLVRQEDYDTIWVPMFREFYDRLTQLAEAAKTSNSA